MKKILLLLLLLNSCIGPIDVQYEKFESIEEVTPPVVKETVTPIPSPVPTVINRPKRERPKKVKTVSSDCLNRKFKFGTGKCCLLHTLSDTRDHQPVTLLPGCFGEAQAFFYCGKKKCIGAYTSGFANPDGDGLRHHWRYRGGCKELESKIGKRGQYIKVIGKDGSEHKREIKSVCQRQE